MLANDESARRAQVIRFEQGRVATRWKAVSNLSPANFNFALLLLPQLQLKDCMSTRRKSKQPRLRNSSSKDMLQPRQPMVVTSGLNAIRIAPRTPKTPWTGHDDEDADEVELNLLDEEDRRLAAQGLGETEEQGFRNGSEAKRQMSAKDRRGMILLIILCECTETLCHV